MSGIAKCMRTGSRLAVARDWAGLAGGTGGERYRVLFVVMEMFWKEVEVMIAQWSEDTKTHWIAHFKMADFMLHELHLN